ncbi:hypothetical protein H0H92_008403, partial [Tricholoma furcatifolium]
MAVMEQAPIVSSRLNSIFWALIKENLGTDANCNTVYHQPNDNQVLVDCQVDN